MTNHCFNTAILLGATLMVLSASAASEIIKCVDEAGLLTYTDQASCDTSATLVPALGQPDAVTNKLLPSQGMAFDGWEARRAAAVKGRTARHPVTPDVDTMKAARTSMLAADKLSPFAHQQNLVALDLRHQEWFDFR